MSIVNNVFGHRSVLQAAKCNCIMILATAFIELSIRFHPTLSGWREKKKSKLIETWLETEGVLALNFVNQGEKNKTKPHKPFTIFHQYPAVPFLN